MATFEKLASLPEDEIDVGLGTILLARDVYPDLDIERTLARFDELAAPLQELRVDGHPLAQASLTLQAEHLREHLHVACGFNGNESDYYDPRNSLISDVLERKLGIPITLSVVYCEVAKRLGVRARGVSFPGHFLVRLDSAHEHEKGRQPVLVDPFFGCRILGPKELAELHAKVMGDAPIAPEALAPASGRAILHRILVNLRAVYLARNDIARAMLTIDRILCLTPNATEPLRERGLLSARLGSREQALADLERFLELAPQAEDAAQIRERLAELKKASAPLN
ncbi:tetratricopeptide repeat protein [Pendulispora brunnea]|uniref:Tetratricopeptide repeat protein n=1 Tax=Pendulispora brunnea TaxID=2905690 RepID=A0ABZ2K4A8_9BACT